MGSIKTITFLGPLEWRNLFGPKSKVSSHEKLVFRSGVGFLFLFVLTDAIFKNSHTWKPCWQNFGFFWAFSLEAVNKKTTGRFWKYDNFRKWHPFKWTKTKIPTPLLKTNFSWLETLLLGLKRFLYFQGPKNAIWLCLSQRQIAF